MFCGFCKEKIYNKGVYDVDAVAINYMTGRDLDFYGDISDDNVLDICDKCFEELVRTRK